MPTINYGIGRARSAEVRSGIIFDEHFITASEIAKNTGVIAGTIASFSVVPRAKTVIARLKQAQATSMTVKINSGQTITITAGSLFGSYTNATAFDADDLKVDDYSKFAYIKIFNRVLDSDTLASYSDGTIWAYDRYCLLWIDGKMGIFDQTRHLDASGNNNHLTIGTGIAKESGKQGYKNTAGLGTMYGNLTSTILAANSGNQTIVYYGRIRDTGFAPFIGNSNMALGVTSSQAVYTRSFKPDKTYSNNSSTLKILPYQKNFVAGIKKSGVAGVYINGAKDALAANVSAFARDITQFAYGYDLNVYLNAADLTTQSDCDLTRCAFYSVALNNMQLLDIFIRMSQDAEV